MKPVRRLVIRGVVLALLLLSLSANVALADDGPASGGGSAQTNLLPEDPGFE